MTLQQFIDKYNGKFVEYHSYDPRAKNQCVDLANQYIVEVLNLTPIIGTNAQDFPKKIGNEFIYIENTPEGLPKAGDLMIFKSADKVGHISIFVEGTTGLFTSFDQNYPTGSPCKLTRHNYKNVLGWLRPKGVIMDDELKALKEKLEWYEREYPIEQQRVTDARRERDEALTSLEQVREELAQTKADCKVDTNAALEMYKLEKERYKDMVSFLADLLATNQDETQIKSELKRLIDIEDLLVKERTGHDYTKYELAESQKVVESLNRTIESLRAELRTAKGLKDATKVELISELLRRLLTIKRGV